MADVIFNMSAEEGRFVSAMMNMLNAQKKVKDEFRDMKKEAKEAEENYIRAGRAQAEAADRAKQKQEELTGKITGTAAALGGGLAVAAYAASKAMQEMFDKAVEKGQKANEQILALAGSLQDFGQVDLLPRVTEQLGKMRSATLSQSQVKGLFSQISQAGGRDASPELRLAATAAAVDAADAGFSDPGKFGHIFVELGKLQATRNLSERQKADLTTQVYQAGGLSPDTIRDAQRAQGMGLNDLGTLQQIVELGMGRDRGGESGKVAGKLLQEALTEIRPEDFKATVTREASPEAQARIKKLEAEREEIEAKQRGLQDRELSMARESAGLDDLSKPQRKEARERLEKERLQINEQQVQLSRRSQDIGQEIGGLRDQKVDVAQPLNAEQQRKRALYLLDQRSRFNAIVSGNLAPDELQVARANIAGNRPDLDFAGAMGDEINDREGAFTKAARGFDAQRQGNSRLAMALRTRQTQVNRENYGQNLQAQAAAMVQAQRDAARDQDGLIVRTIRNVPVAGQVVDGITQASDSQQAGRVAEVYVKNADELARKPKGLAGKSSEGLANGGNE